jgi:hypothetical protein
MNKAVLLNVPAAAIDDIPLLQTVTRETLDVVDVHPRDALR